VSPYKTCEQTTKAMGDAIQIESSGLLRHFQTKLKEPVYQAIGSLSFRESFRRKFRPFRDQAGVLFELRFYRPVYHLSPRYPIEDDGTDLSVPGTKLCRRVL
jgi:hypothetical protein